MTFKLPDKDELKSLAASMGLTLDDRQTETLLRNMGPFADGYRYLDELGDNLSVQHHRPSGHVVALRHAQRSAGGHDAGGETL